MSAYRTPVPGDRVRVRRTQREGVLAADRSRGTYLEIGNQRQVLVWHVYFPESGAVEIYDISHLELLDD